MSLARTSILSAISTVVRLLCGLIINKVVAIIGGPAGFALVSQLQNTFALTSTLSAGAMSNGITILTARTENDVKEQQQFFVAAFLMVGATSLPFAVLGIVYAPYISELLFTNTDYFYVIIAAAVTIPLYAFGSMLTAIVTGKQDVVSLVTINIASSVLTLISVTTFAWQYGLPGALVATATYQVSLLLVALWWLRHRPWLRLRNIVGQVRKTHIMSLLQFTLMAGISGVCINLAQLFIRNHLIYSYGVESAGLWDTVNRISMLNWSVMSAILSIYLLPKFASIIDQKELYHEIILAMKYIMPTFISICLLLSFMADYLILVLFTKDFAEAADFLPVQLLGDVARVFSWFYAYTLIARQHIRHYAFIEIASNAAFVAVAILGSSIWGAYSPVIANAVAFILLAFYCSFKIRLMAR